MHIPTDVVVTYLICFRILSPGMIISHTASWRSISFEFDSMAWSNDYLYGYTVQLFYFPRVAIVGVVTSDAAVECFCGSWDFDVAVAVVPAAVVDEISINSGGGSDSVTRGWSGGDGDSGTIVWGW